MDAATISNALISYLCFIIVLTFHEWAHAWVALMRGDDTAKLLGRVSFNPIIHMEVIGTVVLPLVGLFLSMSGSSLASFVIGWGKPVPVDPRNLKNRALDGSMIAMAGPAMNVVVAFGALGLAKLALLANNEMLRDFSLNLAIISMALCFFNLLPIPPLDGSHVLRYLIGMSDEMFYGFCRYGIFVLIVVLQIKAVRTLLGVATLESLKLMSRVFGMG